ncbi:MAG: molybdopterin converting factor subunit 1 [Burkholderiales bacterium RIFCSPLOWO2_02_FULL_57_36]|nr:MAG: molybdopterin converting factor subunit 1 [Burkholderiales bacterium RIFCSPLOWO2_02_FULL_57_36]
MNLEIRYFASVRETLGRSGESVSLPAEVRTLADLRAYLVARGAPWSEALADGRALRIACNQQMATPETLLSPGCEVAFFPPVTGG